MLVVPNSASLLALLAVKTDLLDGATLKLYQNDVAPGRTMLLGDLDEADFSGYAAYLIALWSQPFLDIGGIAITVAPSHSFVHDGGVVGNLIYGMYLVSSGGALIYAERFDAAPIPMQVATSALVVLPKLSGKSQF